MSLKVLMHGVDVTRYCNLPSLKISEDILNDQWECDIESTIFNQVISRPKANTELIVMNDTSYEFAGVISTTTEDQIDPTGFRYSTVAGNYSPWFDRHMVNEDYPQQNADVTAKAIVSGFCPGFTTNHVQTGPVIPRQKLDYKPPTQSIKNIANLLSWAFYIDYEKDVHLFLSESIPSPLPNNTLNADTDLLNYGDLQLEEDGSQVKNRIIAKGFKVMSQSTVPIYITCDGQNDTYKLPQLPAGTSSKYMSITVGGTTYTPKADVASGLPSDAKKNDHTAYVNMTNQTVRFDPTPGNGAIATGSMYYKYQPVYVQDDPALIQTQAAIEGTDGIYEYAVQDPKMSGDDTALAQARTSYLLAKYGTPNLTGTLVSYTPGWRAGQTFYLHSNRRMGGISNKLMYVAKCEKTYVSHPLNGTPVIKYALTISDRPYLF